jgi:tetratricopeptide (TPR) repeat protein
MFKRPITVLLILLFSSALALPCVAEDSPDEYLAKAMKSMDKGDEELQKAANSFDADHSHVADHHLNEAMGDYKKAVDDLAKAVVPTGNDAALKSLNDGLDKIDKAVKELEKGNYDEANQLYLEGQADFASASELLGG